MPVFYYELGSPDCWLVAERIASTMPVVPEFVPILRGELAPALAPDRSAIARRARELGLLALRWPARWPPNGELAALTATYAAGIGKVVAFSLAAFRQEFAAGRDLDEEDTVLIAAAACEMHPRAVLRAVQLSSVAAALRRAGARAREAGVRRVPAITVAGLVLEGEDCPERAAAALGQLREPVR